jgi:hypothetical protein
MPSPTSFTRSKEQRRAYSFIPVSFLAVHFGADYNSVASREKVQSATNVPSRDKVQIVVVAMCHQVPSVHIEAAFNEQQKWNWQ